MAASPLTTAAEELFLRFLGGVGYGFKSKAVDLEGDVDKGLELLVYKHAAVSIYDMSTVSLSRVILPARFQGWRDAIHRLGGRNLGAATEFRRSYRKGYATITSEVILVPAAHVFNRSGEDEVRFLVTLTGQPKPRANVKTLNTFRRIIRTQQLLADHALPWMLGQWHGGNFL